MLSSTIFTGNANPKLAKDVARLLNTRLGKAEIARFSDGEIRVEVNETVRGQDVFIIQSTCNPANDNLMELLLMGDALRRSATNRLIAVIPYFGYARQDRRPNFSRVSITSRLVADMIQAAGFDSVIFVDIHSTQQQGFFKIPTINISASPIIVSDIWRKYMKDPSTAMVVSPDVGGVARARSIAKQLDDAELAIVDKRRPEANVSEVMNIIGDVEGRNCIMIDDMADTAGTLCKAASALKEHGAKTVAAYCTHPVLSGPAYENIASSSALDELVVTDTIPLKTITAASLPIRTLSVAELIAETISRIDTDKSVSELYVGE